MELNDFTTNKIKKEMKYWGKLTIICSAIAALMVPVLVFVSIPAIMTVALSAFLISGPIALLYTLPRYAEERKAYNKHHKWLVENQNDLTHADNHFEMKDENKKIKLWHKT